MERRIKAMKEELSVALENRDAHKVASMFDLPEMKCSSRKFTNRETNKSLYSLKSGGQDWTNIIMSWFEASKAAEVGDPIACYKAQSTLHSSFHVVFSSSSGNWLVPTLQVICKNTHKMALLADKEAVERNKKQNASAGDNSKLQNAVTLLQESYSKTFNDRKDYKPNEGEEEIFDENGSKKAGVLVIVNELFAMYFFLNTLRLCKNLVRPVETRKLHCVGQLGPRVTYRYFVGRLCLFEDQYTAAEGHLDYAFKNCPPTAERNKRCILRYLVPVNLVRGRLPTTQLLEKYKLPEFLPIVQGMRQGDLRTFHDGLVQHQDLFIRRGTYLLLEKCKTVCYRNLFKRIHYLLESHQIKLKDVATALKWLGMPIDLDEVECILANLIFRGYVRGYLSHAKRVLVLSKRDPFPVTAVVVGTRSTTSSASASTSNSSGFSADAAMKG